MVAIVSGDSLGLSLTSLATLGQDGSTGVSSTGRNGEQAFVNVATGNLVLQDRDEFLIGVGPDAATVRTYNSQGQILGAVQDSWSLGAAGQRVALSSGSLQAAGSTLTRTDRDGAQALFTWDAPNSRYLSTDGTGAYDTITWDGAANEYAFADGDTSLVERYDTSGRLVRCTDPDGNTLTYGYNGDGSLASMTSASGEETVFEYSGDQLTQIHTLLSDGSSSTRVHYSYDANGRLSSVLVDLSPTDNSIADGKVYQTTYGYDGSSNRIASVTQSDGSALRFSYVQIGSEFRIASVQDALLQTTTYSYDTQNRTTTVLDPLGVSTVYGYNAAEQLISISSPVMGAPASDQQSHIELQTIQVAQIAVASGLDQDGHAYLAWARPEAGTVVSLRYRPQGGADAQWISLASSAPENQQQQVDVSELAAGNYEFDLLQTARGSSVPTARALGSFTVNAELPDHIELRQVSVPTLAVQLVTSVNGQTLIGWGVPADGTSSSFRYRPAGGTDAQWTSVQPTPDAQTGLQTADVSGLQAGSYEYELVETLLGSAQPTARATGTLTLNITTPLAPVDPTTQPPTSNTQVTRTGDGLYSLTWPANAPDEWQTVRYRLVGTSEWIEAPPVYQYSPGVWDLSQLAAGTYEYEIVKYLDASPGVPVADWTGTLQIFPGTKAHYETLDGPLPLLLLRSPAQTMAPAPAPAPSLNPPEWNGTRHYLPGDTVLRNGIVYTATAESASLWNENAAPEWTPNLWSAATSTVPAPAPSAAPAEWDGTTRYFAGDSVLRNGVVYMATELSNSVWNENSPPEWTPNLWSVVADSQTGDAGAALPTLSWPAPPAGSTSTFRYRPVAGDEASWQIYPDTVDDGNGNRVANFGDLPLPWADLSKYEFEIVQADSNGVPTSRVGGILTADYGWDNGVLHFASISVELGRPQYSVESGVWTVNPTVPSGSLQVWTPGSASAPVAAAMALTTSVIAGNYTLQDTSSGSMTVPILVPPTPVPPTVTITPISTMEVEVSVHSGQQFRTFSYNARGDVTGVADSGGHSVSMEYDASGNQVLRRDGAGNTVVRSFNASNQLLSETIYLAPDTDSAGPAQPHDPLTTHNLYSSTRPTQLRFVVSAEGRVTEYRYNAAGERTSTLNYLAGTYQGAAVDESALAAWVATQPAGDITRSDMAYDLRGQLQSTTVFNAVDAAGEGIADGSQSATHYVYDVNGRLLTTVDATGAATSYSYDGLGRMLAFVNALGQASINSYDDAGNQVTVTTANGLSTTSAYDKAGRLLSVTESSSASASLGAKHYFYDADGRLVGTQDPTDVRSWLLYDVAGRRSADVDGNGALTEYRYNDSGLLTQTIRYAAAVDTSSLSSADGRPASPALDAIRPAVTSADASTWRAYDSAGRLAKTVDEAGAVTEYSYDGASRLVATRKFAATIATTGLGTHPAPTDIVTISGADDRITRNFYDGDGLLLATLDAEGYLTESHYDAAARLVAKTVYATHVAAGLRVAGPLQQLRPAEDPGDESTTYLLNGRGQVAGEIDAEGYLTETIYDGDGRATQATRYASRVAAGYSTRSTLASVRPASDASDRTSHWIYDALGRVVVAVNAEGTATRYSYDEAGNLVTEIDAANTSESRASIVARYDAQGRLTAELSAVGYALLDGTQSQAQIDAIWSQYGMTHTYDGAGRRTSTVDQNGNRTLFFYDLDGHLTHSVNAFGEVTETQYNALGQRTAEIRYGTRIATGALAGGLETGALQATLNAIANAAKDSRVAYTYTVDGNLATITDALGNVTQLGYNSFGEEATRVSVSSAGTARTDVTAHDHRGLVTVQASLGDGLSISSSVTHDAFGRPVRTVDASGNVRQSAYDRLGRAVLSVDPLGASRATSYDAFGHVLAQTDALGHTTAYSYDTATRSVTVTSPENIAVRTSYNRLGQTQTVTDGLGNVTRFSYDKNGNLLSTATPLTVKSNTYDAGNRLISTTDADGRVVSFAYDAASRVLTRTLDASGLNLVTRYSYDTAGRRIAITDPNGALTQLVYDLKGQLKQQIVDPAGLNLITSYGYSARGDVLTVTTPVGMVTVYHYDALGRRTSEIADPSGVNRGTTYTYDASNNVASKTDALNNVTRFAYDADDRLVFTLSPLGELQKTTYDAEGRVSRTTAYATRIDINGLSAAPSTAELQSRVVATAGKDADQYRVYDAEGRLAATVSGAGEAVRYRYDANGNVIERAASAGLVDMGSWVPGSMPTPAASLTPDQVTRTVYDALNRAVYTIDGAGGVVHFTYDGNSNVVERAAYAHSIAAQTPATASGMAAALQAAGADAADQTERSVYDVANRLTWRADGTGAVTRFIYDANGNLTGTIHFANQAGSGQSLESVVQSAADRVTLYAYDTAGRRTFQVDALGGVTRWAYDQNGNATTRIDYAARAAAATLGAAVSDTLMKSRVVQSADDRVQHWLYDAMGRQTLAVDANGAVTENRYDALGNNTGTTQYARQTGAAGSIGLTPTESQLRLLIAPDAAADRVTVRTFDAEGRLVYTVDAMGYVTRNEYDGLGQTVKTIAYAAPLAAGIGEPVIVRGIQQTANAASDRVTAFAYDGAGRLASSTDAMGFTENYTYDALGRKTSFVNKNRNTWTYAYDGAGRMVRETAPEVTVMALQQTGTNLVIDDAQTGGRAIVTQLAYDALGNLTSRTEAAGLPEQRVTLYGYDALGRQTKVSYPDSTFYDAAQDDLASNGISGNAQRVETTATLWTSTAYDAFGDAVVGRDLAGHFSYKTYDKVGQLAWEVDALNYVTGYERNSFGETTRLVRYAGQVSLANPAHSALSGAQVQAAVLVVGSHQEDRELRSDYDKRGRVIRVSEPVVFGYDPSAAAGQQYFNAGKVTENTYDAFGDLTQVALLRASDGSRSIENRYYDKVGNQIGTVDAMGYVTAQEFDGERNLIKHIEYSNAIAGWNGSLGANGAQPFAGVPQASSDDRQVNSAFDRDNRKISDTRVAMHYVDVARGLFTTGDLVTSYGCDAVGNQTRSTDALGDTTYTYYDALGRVRAVASPTRHALVDGAMAAVTPLTAFGRDANGNVVAKVQFSGGAAVANETSVAGIGGADNRVTLTQYDRFGHSTHSTDAAGNNQYASYDEAGHLAKQWQNVTINVLRTKYTAYQYDALGRQTAVISPASTVRPVDGDNVEVVSQAVAGNEVQALEYNAFGEVVRKGIDGDMREHFDYDNAGRVWRTNSQGGVEMVFFYDRQGDRTAEISSDGSMDIGAFTRADQLKDLAAVRRTDTYYDALGRAVKEVRPERAEAQGGLTQRQNFLAFAIAENIQRTGFDSGSPSDYWRGENKVALSWSSLEGLGAGDVKVELSYSNMLAPDGEHVYQSASRTAVYTASEANTGVTLSWPGNGFDDFPVGAVNEVRVFKKDLAGEWQQIFDRTQPGAFGYALEVTVPDSVNTAPRLQTRLQGTQAWVDVSQAQMQDFGNVGRFDASVLGTGVYEYRVLSRQIDGSESVTASGSVDLAPPQLEWLSISTGFGPAGPNVFAWPSPPIGQTQQLLMRNLDDASATPVPVTNVQVYPGGYSGVDMSAQPAGRYEYELRWTRAGESSAYAHSTGQLTVERASVANIANVLPIVGVKIAQQLIDGQSIPVLQWPAAPAGTTTAFLWRLKGEGDTAWRTIPGDQFGFVDGGPDGLQQYGRLNGIPAGNYEFKLEFTAAGASAPTQHSTGVFTISAVPVKQITVLAVPNLDTGVVDIDGVDHPYMQWALPPEGSGTMWRYRPAGDPNAEWSQPRERINGVGDGLIDLPLKGVQVVDLYGIAPGQYEYELWNAYQSEFPTHRAAGLMTIAAAAPGTATIDVTAEPVSIGADPVSGQPRMNWTLPVPGTLAAWTYRAVGETSWHTLVDKVSVDHVDLGSLPAGNYEYKLVLARPGIAEPTDYASGSLTIYALVPAHVELQNIPVQPIVVQADVVAGNQHPYLWWNLPPQGTVSLARYRVAGATDSQWVTAPVISDPLTGRQAFDLFGVTPGNHEFDVWLAYPGASEPTHRAMGTVTVFASIASHFELKPISVASAAVSMGVTNNHPYMAWHELTGSTVTWRYRPLGGSEAQWKFIAGFVSDPTTGLQAVDLLGVAAGDYEYEMVQTAAGSAVPTGHATGTLHLSAPTGGFFTNQSVPVAIIPIRPLLAGGNGAPILTWSIPAAGTAVTFRYSPRFTGQWTNLPVINDPADGVQGVDVSAIPAGSYDYEMVETAAGSAVPTAHATGSMSLTAPIPGHFVTQTVAVPLVSTNPSTVSVSGVPFAILSWPLPGDGAVSTFLYRPQGSGGAWQTGQVIFDPSVNLFLANLNPLGAGNFEFQMTERVNGATVRGAAGTVFLNGAGGVSRTSLFNLTTSTQVFVAGTTPVPVVSPTTSSTMTAQVFVPLVQPLPTQSSTTTSTMLYQQLVASATPLPRVSSTPQTSMVVERLMDARTPPPDYTNAATTSLLIDRLVVPKPSFSNTAGDTMVVETGVAAPPTFQDTTPPYDSGLHFRLSHLDELPDASQAAPDKISRPIVLQTLDRWGNVVEMTDPRNAQWRSTYQYNANNQIVQQRQPTDAGGLGPITFLSYDALGRQLGVTDARGNTSFQLYDAGGNVTLEHHADGGEVTYRYDVFGDKVATIDALGFDTQFSYDKLGRMTQTSRAAVPSYHIDQINDGTPGGELSPALDTAGAPSRRIESYTYDELGQRIALRDAAGKVTSYLYDLRGDIVRSVAASGETTVTAWDNQHRRILELQSTGKFATWQYDYFGALKEHKDQGGAMFEYVYDSAQQLVQVRQSNDTRGKDVSYRYDAAGQLVEQRALVQRGAAAAAEGGATEDVWNTTLYSYDLAGNRTREKVLQTTRLEDGRSVDATYQDNHLSYDALGRLKLVEDGRAQVRMEYDAVGNRTRIETHVILGESDQHDQDRYFTYDVMNRQTGVDLDVNRALGSQGHIITYDVDGNRKTDAFASADANGAIQQHKDVYTYDGEDRLVDANRDGKLIDQRFYDSAGRVIQSIAADGTEVRTTIYNENGTMNLQRVLARDVASGNVTGFKYDIEYTSYSGTDLLTYDVWNRGGPSLMRTTYTNTYAYFEGARQLGQTATSNPEEHVHDGSTHWNYDVNGNLVSFEDSTQPENNRSFVNDATGYALYSNQGGHVQRQLVVNGEVLGRYGEAKDGSAAADFNFNFQPVNGNYPASVPTEYMVVAGNSLQSIAKAVYGDERMWYLIADANGLTGNGDLQVGQVLRIPPGVANSNTSSSFKPYDPSAIVGDTNPNQTPIPQGNGGGCGGLGQIIMIAVAIVVTIYTAGAAAELVAAAGSAGTATASVGFAGTMASGVTALGGGYGAMGVTAAAAGGAAGSIASQGVGIAIGAQDRFDWKGVALSALAAGGSAGVGMAFGGPVAPNVQGVDRIVQLAQRAAVSSIATQGLGVVTRLQEHFNWTAVAASAAGAGLGEAVAQRIGDSAFAHDFGGFGVRTISGFAAGAATAVLRGGRVSVEQVARDAFGNALGGLIADGSGRSSNPTSAYDYQNEMDRASDNARAHADALYGFGAARLSGQTGSASAAMREWSYGVDAGFTSAANKLTENGLTLSASEATAESMQSLALNADELRIRKADVQRQVQLDILGQQENENSLQGGQLLQVGGPARSTARGLGNGGFEMVRNGNWDGALNMGADPYGVLPDLAGLQQDVSKMGRIQAESRIGDMRQRMTEAGMKDVPSGYRQALVEGGLMVRDYRSTVDDLQTRYEGFVRDKRLQETWGENYQSLRLGKSQMTVLEFEKRVLDVQQQASNKYYEKGVELIAKGELLINGDYARTLGNYIDGQVRFELRGLAKVEGINDSMTSNVWAVNRSIRSDIAEGRGIPDNRLGYNLFADTTLSPKNGYTEQIMRWNAIRPDANYLIIRPTNMPGGGSYVIPRTAIQPFNQARSVGRPL